MYCRDKACLVSLYGAEVPSVTYQDSFRHGSNFRTMEG